MTPQAPTKPIRPGTIKRLAQVSKVLEHPNVTGRLLWDGATNFPAWRNPRPFNSQRVDFSKPVVPIPLMNANQMGRELASIARRPAAGGHEGLTDDERCIYNGGGIMTRGLKLFTDAYLDAMAFAGGPVDDRGDDLDSEGFSPELLAEATADCAAFYAEHEEDIAEYGESHAGQDYWFTRNGQGVGFWEEDHGTPEICARLDAAAKAAGPVDLYRGDDGMIYQ